jgi:hypothetical protein
MSIFLCALCNVIGLRPATSAIEFSPCKFVYPGLGMS